MYLYIWYVNKLWKAQWHKRNAVDNYVCVLGEETGSMECQLNFIVDYCDIYLNNAQAGAIYGLWLGK